MVLELKKVALITSDGAAVGVVAKRQLQMDIEGLAVCSPHDTASAILWALRVGTKGSKNPESKKQIKANRRIGTFFHQSTDRTKKLIAAQTKKGVAKGRELGAAVGDVSR